MSKTRMEAFSDGVVAILITIMVLELKVPHGADLAALRPLLPVFLTYVLSFVMLGIYWNNHHHMLHATEHVNGKILWANLNLLFWLSLVPAVTGWMGENHLAPLPTAVFGVDMICAAIVVRHPPVDDRSRRRAERKAEGSRGKGFQREALASLVLDCDSYRIHRQPARSGHVRFRRADLAYS